MGVLSDFQTAIYTTLIADSTLTGLVNGSDHIGDWPDPDGPFPWITIGEDAESEDLNKNESNYQTDATIHVWSKKRGWKECNQIVDQLDVLLLGTLVVLPGSSSFTIMGKAQRPKPTVKLPGDDKGLIRHIVATYHFWISC